MDQLPIFLNLSGVAVLLVGEGEAAGAKRRLIEGAGGIVTAEPGAARIAFVALDDDAAAATAARDLRARGLLVNVVDRPALCDFTVPAIVDRSPVIVAVGTGGASATLAKALRERFEALLPSALGLLAAALLAARRRIAARHPSAADRRRFLDRLLEPGGRLDPLYVASDVETALDTALGEADFAAAELVEILVAGPDPDDLSLRDLRRLSRADAIIHDSAVPAAVLDRARRDAVRIPGGGKPAATGLTVTLRWTGA